MGTFLDSVPMSGIVRIRDMMYTIKNPFRLDQGDVSFDAPDTVKQAMTRAIADNHTHYLPTTGLPRLRQLIAEKLRTKNHIPVESDDDIIVTNGYTTRARDVQSLTIQQPVLTCCPSDCVWINPGGDQSRLPVRVRVEHTTSACLRANFNPGKTETASMDSAPTAHQILSPGNRLFF